MRAIMFCFILGIVVLGCSRDQSEEVNLLKLEHARLQEFAGPPPASLERFYPPKAPAPLYQIKMFDMATPLTGCMIKMSEGDRQGAKAFFDSFRQEYTELSGLVPEWKNAFPTEPIDELARRIEEGEPGKVMEAMGNVDKICQDCHLPNMPKVQQQYHWQDFSVISLTDPATKANVDFNHFMLSLDMSFVGIGLELQGGNLEQARKQYDDFKNGFDEMKQSCQACHQTERTYFVDADIDRLIGNLGAALKAPVPAAGEVAQLSQHIGMESCNKCHLVHIPAAYAKTRWMNIRQGAGEK